jgi:hypothetical protein
MAKNGEFIMRKMIGIGIVGVLVLGLSVGAEAGGTKRLMARPSRTIKAINSSSVVTIKEGRVIQGTVHWPKASLGKPTGNATEACQRVRVMAIDGTSPFPDTVGAEKGSTHGTPVDVNDVTKGCNFELTNLPGDLKLLLDAFYAPGTAWTPQCNLEGWECSNEEMYSVTLPKSGGAKVSGVEVHMNFVKCFTPGPA